MSREMRLESEKSTSTLNGARYNTNGGVHSPKHKATGSNSTNGCPSQAINGSTTLYQNGSSSILTKPTAPTFFGHNREEVARLLIQGLNDLGYGDSANKLIQESGFELESPSSAAFRHAILEGEWSEAEALLFGSSRSDEGGGVSISSGHSRHHKGLVLSETADKNELRFQLRRQKYLELLEKRDHGPALMVLRQELTPLHQDVEQLHLLSGLMVCQSPDELKTQASWDGAEGTSRSLLLTELSRSISPSVMVPDHRLAVLLDQVKQNQISKCLYHNPTTSHSLFADHICDRSQFPLQTILELSQADEVWFLEFSHDGRRLATSGQGCSVTIYDTDTFAIRHCLAGHSNEVAYVCWSYDDTKLITCSHDKKAKIWDTDTGQVLFTILNNNDQPVTSAAWAPDGLTFVTGTLDKKNHLSLWNLDGQNLYNWSNDYRVVDLAISPDGQRLVTISAEKQIFVYNFITREEEYSLRLKTELTCINISHDSKHMLINMSDNELQLIDINSAEIVRRFLGQKQGKYVIRSAFGGADENLVISGSEDGLVYIWHKENGTLIETLKGHGGGCVNSVAWNPADPCMFASAGDDKKVRIWSKETSARNRSSQNGSHYPHSGHSTFSSGTSI